MINVTRSFLPNIEKYKHYVDQIFESSTLTNNGPLVQELEIQLKDYLGVNNILLVANGTLALQLAYKLLELSGEVITTPFSFAATSSSIIWGDLEPVYTDIHSGSLNLDPRTIEATITDKTSAIVPVHVFGNACATEEITRISDNHKLKIIYDASHAFGIRSESSSLLNSGDISTLSFHATKLFHTAEGGALVINDDELMAKARSMINFGLDKNGIPSSLGINAKMSELHAAMGLCVLESIDEIFSQRKMTAERYYDKLNNLPVSFQERHPDYSNNYAYLPILFENAETRMIIEQNLVDNRITPRQYFYPSLETIYAPNTPMPKSRDVASRILCLPLYAGIEPSIVDNICTIIIDSLDCKK